MPIAHSVKPRSSAGSTGTAYTVDNVGNRTAKTDMPANTTSNFSYDNIYQLTQVTQGAATPEAYSYDVVGNRLSSVSAATWSYNSSNHLTSISGTPGTTFTYDNNGNTVTKVDASGTTTYAWDYENRLTSVTLPNSGGIVSFTYDPMGRRIRKIFGSATTIYAYDSENIIEETDGAGTVVARYAPGLNIDEPLAMLRSSATHYYSADGLGSIISLTDSAGSVAATYTYDSFGNLTASTGSLTNPFRYTAREWDGESQSYFYRARYYDSGAGRFVSEDPINFNGGENFYSYVGNHSPNFSDPSGLQKVPSTGQEIRPASPRYNCLAWGLGTDLVWIQPPIGSSPNKVFPHFGCTKVGCNQNTDCKKRSMVKVFEDASTPDNWHVERKTCNKGWTSKYGREPLFDRITDPDADYKRVYKPKGKTKVTCWSCPAGPPKVFPIHSDIEYIYH